MVYRMNTVGKLNHSSRRKRLNEGGMWGPYSEKFWLRSLNHPKYGHIVAETNSSTGGTLTNFWINYYQIYFKATVEFIAKELECGIEDLGFCSLYDPDFTKNKKINLPPL